MEEVGTGARLAVGGGASVDGAPPTTWGFPALLAAASAGEELRPSDLLASGPLTGEVRVGRGVTVTAAVDGLGALTADVATGVAAAVASAVPSAVPSEGT